MKFLKKFFREKPTEKEEIDFKDINHWIRKEQNKLEDKEKKASEEIQKRISFFANELNKKIEIVESFNLDAKKAEDRLKILCDEGRKKYIELLVNFMDKLKYMEKKRVLETQKDIDKAFLGFTKSSTKNYEKATILIGKEMSSLRQTIKDFSKELLEIFNSNQDLILSQKRVLSIKSILKEIEEIENKTNKNLEEIKISEKRIVEKKEENEEILSRIKEIKNSKEYSENLERKKKITETQNKLEKEILKLKQEINFKDLASFYHVFEKKMKMVKELRENFQNILKRESGGEKLTKLLEEAKLNSENISKGLENIEQMKKDIITKKNEISEDKTVKLRSNSEMLISGIEDLEKEISIHKKNIEDFESQKKELMEEIKDELSELNVDLKL